jgi:hypothetical protein
MIQWQHIKAGADDFTESSLMRIHPVNLMADVFQKISLHRL